MTEYEEGTGPDGPGSRVTLLSSRDLPRAGSLLAQIESHWRELGAETGGLARRADLDAGRIAAALPHAFILERAARIGRIRIAGQAFTRHLGAEARGVPLSVLFSAEARPVLQDLLDRCFDMPALIEVGVTSTQGAFRSSLTGRLLLLPLLDAEGEVTRALGGLLIDGVPRSEVMRFDLAVTPPRCEPIVRPAPRSLFALASAPSSRSFAESERPYLRLVVSNS